jgi:hypothetical protein
MIARRLAVIHGFGRNVPVVHGEGANLVEDVHALPGWYTV